MQGLRLATTLTKDSVGEGATLPDFRNYYKITVKTALAQK